MGTSDEDFCLKWNDHHSIFFSLAESLCRSSLLTDVTLATSDQTFPAHKLVLSVCSSFFRDLFSKPEMNLNVNQSVVYLKDVSSRQLEMLLSYMYRGEINVEEGDLVKLLQTAKGLGVKGLSEVDDQNAFGKKSVPAATQAKTDSRKRPRSEEFQGLNIKQAQTQAYEDVIEVAPPRDIEYNMTDGVEAEVVEPNILTINSNNLEITEETGAWYDDDDIGEGEGFEDYDKFDQGSGSSGYPAGSRKDVPEPPLNCPQCPKTFASTWHLKRHVATHTKEKRYKCHLCGKFFSRNDNLKSHQKSVHGVLNQNTSSTHLLDY